MKYRPNAHYKRPYTTALKVIITATAVLAAVPALAKNTPTDAERRAAYARGVAADQAAIQESYRQQQEAYDKAIAAANKADKVLRAASNRAVPGLGGAVYDGGKTVGSKLFTAIKKRKNR